MNQALESMETWTLDHSVPLPVWRRRQDCSWLHTRQIFRVFSNSRLYAAILLVKELVIADHRRVLGVLRSNLGWKALLPILRIVKAILVHLVH